MNPWLKKAMSLVTAAGLAAPMLYVSTNVTTANAAPIKIGVALTYNNTPFWSAYISLRAAVRQANGRPAHRPLGLLRYLWHQRSPCRTSRSRTSSTRVPKPIILNPEDASADRPLDLLCLRPPRHNHLGRHDPRCRQ